MYQFLQCSRPGRRKNGACSEIAAKKKLAEKLGTVQAVKAFKTAKSKKLVRKLNGRLSALLK